MVTYMTTPQNKLTLGVTEYTNYLVSASIQRIENGFDTAVIVLPTSTIYPTSVTQGTSVQLEVKETGGAYTTIFKGVVRFPVINWKQQTQNSLTLFCDGAGYGFAEMLVGNEYGSQSTNASTDTLTEIATDIVNNYVNKTLGGDASGHSYTISTSIASSIPYIEFPYKPASKCLNDLLDVVTAQEAGDAGPHWIVTTDDVLHIKFISATQVGWTKYYGDSQANATLTYGTDYTDLDFEKLAPEANYILYYGVWRRPSNGDAWTESASSLWGKSDARDSLSDDSTNKMVGLNSLKFTVGHAPDNYTIYYPSSKDLALDLSIFADLTIPTLQFYLRRGPAESVITSCVLRVCTDDSNYFSTTLTLPTIEEFGHYILPLGAYYKTYDDSITWSETLNPDWNDINSIQFYFNGAMDDTLNIDGLFIGNASICRVAHNSDATITRMKLIVDDIGKNDTLTAGTPGTTDTGLMAQLAYAELLRAQSTPLVGSVICPMIKDALPGQWFYVQSTDMRCTKILHTITGGPQGSYSSQIFLTDDIVNGCTRLRFEDQNKVWESIRPEWQDRQASNIKAGSVNWRIPRLVEDYA